MKSRALPLEPSIPCCDPTALHQRQRSCKGPPVMVAIPPTSPTRQHRESAASHPNNQAFNLAPLRNTLRDASRSSKSCGEPSDGMVLFDNSPERLDGFVKAASGHSRLGPRPLCLPSSCMTSPLCANGLSVCSRRTCTYQSTMSTNCRALLRARPGSLSPSLGSGFEELLSCKYL